MITFKFNISFLFSVFLATDKKLAIIELQLSILKQIINFSKVDEPILLAKCNVLEY